MTDDMNASPQLDIPTTAVEHLRQLAKVSPESSKPTGKKPVPEEPKVPHSPAGAPPPPTSQATKVNPPSAKAEPSSQAPPSSSSDASLPGGKGKDEAISLSSDTYNGSQTEKYTWSQTMTDIDVRAPIPDGITAKDLRVEITKDRLKVELLKPERKVRWLPACVYWIVTVLLLQTLMDGQLLHRVKVEESMWSVDKASRHIYINLEKQKDIMWKSVFEGEEGIDLTKVDTTRDISEFDQEAQAAIQRVTFDHQMKMLGKPTSSEQVLVHVH